MSDRVAHDHPTIETIPATIGRFGRTTRPEIRIDETLDIEEGIIIHLVLEGTELRAMVERHGGSQAIRGAYKTPRMARNPGSGENYLESWVEKRDLEPGRTVHLDVVEPGFKYGLRAPGESGTYTTGRPDSSLSDIAKKFGLE